jgi:hypothetical protein
MLSASSEVDLAIRLHEFSLLPENRRQEFVSKIVSYTFDGDDLYAIESKRIQSVFKPAELKLFRRRWRDELVKKLSDIRWTWQSNHDSQQQPEDHMQPLIDSFNALKKEFAGDTSIVSEIERQIKNAEEWISEKLAEDDGQQSRPPRVFGDVDAHEQLPAQARSIFDDIDE